MKIYIETPYYKEYLLKHASFPMTLVESKKEAEVIVSGRFKETDYSKNLKAVIVPYTGLDGIDLAFIKKMHIPLFNTTDHSKFVSEKALQLILSLLGNVPLYHNNLKEGLWSQRTNEDRIPWVSLFDKKIGIYGYGRIGQILHRLLEPFHCEVSIIDRGKKYPNVVYKDSLETLVSDVDIVVIATPLTPKTRGVFNQEILTLMKDKYLINVGRGPIIEEKALYEALNSQHLKGFASDVWYQYPSLKEPEIMPSKYPITAFNNVVLSPHCGGYTTQFSAVMIKNILRTLESVFKEDYDEAVIYEK